ncbi:MAG: DUF3883 domain-containing protein [Muribaculum sp.]|nr:DUF3883 domain-containing protein [Muribaculum sp.]
MIFKVHDENIFGVKKLTDADLGQNVGHQTHIGLIAGVLSYLNNDNDIKESYLIFKNKCERLDCYFNRILGSDGNYRSAKIKSGTTDSIVRRIREYASQTKSELYLMWFSLDNEELLFLLFEKDSNDYDFFNSAGCINGKYSFSQNVLEYVFARFNQTNQNTLIELELSSQGVQSLRHYRRIDLERANKLFRDTGQNGEKLVCEYLDKLRFKSDIIDFSWMNQSRESGLPYDFKIIQNDKSERFVDVKTTRFNFDTPMVFSSQETSFITNEPIIYSVYRTYDIANEVPKLRICDNSREKIKLINEDHSTYSAICQSHGYRVQSSFLVLPTDPMFNFSQDIFL